MIIPENFTNYELSEHQKNLIWKSGIINAKAKKWVAIVCKKKYNSGCKPKEQVAICEICGYQWNTGEERFTTTFFLFCPVCDSNLVHQMEKKDNPEDGKPWF